MFPHSLSELNFYNKICERSASFLEKNNERKGCLTEIKLILSDHVDFSIFYLFIFIISSPKMSK